MLLSVGILLCQVVALAQVKVVSDPTGNARKRWVDSVYSRLSTQERIGQLFMVAAYSGGRDYNEPAITELVTKGQIGGVIFMQGDPVSQAKQTNKYQQTAQVPLLVGMDAEWGLGMRLKGVRDFPRQMMLGATADSSIAYRLGAAIARQCNRIGVHVNFAPVVDVNNNPNNPIINARSFSEDKRLVARLGIAYMNGLQNNGVMACAKHFPGHGDTETDSHHDLPVISKSLKQLDTLELFPFRRLINAGVQSIMVAHLEVPALGTGKHEPTTLSRNTITNVLKNQMGFSGLVFTDALNMQGVAKYFEPGEVDVRAFAAGNDVLLFSQNVPVAIDRIQAALKAGTISQAQLEKSVKRILAAKFNAGLHSFVPINPTNILADLNSEADAIRTLVTEKAATMVSDRHKLIAQIRSANKVGFIGVNATQSQLQTTLNNFIPNLRSNWLPKGSKPADYEKVKAALKGNDVTIVAVHNMAFYPSGGNYGLDASQVSFLKQLQNHKKVVFVVMGNAYLLKNFCSAGSIVVSYEDDSITNEVVAKILLGQANAQGTLPVTPCPGMARAAVSSGQGVLSEVVSSPAKVNKLQKVMFVKDAGVVDPDALDKLSMFIQRSIVSKAFPGCRILAAKDGKIFYDEAFGYYDYTKEKGVELFTMYDVASMTKVLSTTLAVMRLVEQGKLNLNRTLSDYLPWTRGTDKAGIVVRDLLLHQAGLKAWIPFYKETIDSTGNPDSRLYSESRSLSHSVPVAKDMYLRNDYPDTVWKRILESPLDRTPRYVYSDLDFLFLAALVEQITNMQLNKYVEEQFYKPMGLERITYNPLKKFKLSNVTPTENDLFFRKQVIRGYVHDQAAALFGGVAGHAGLFATAEDAAAVFQMLLNGGTYNGKRFFKEQTVEKFIAYNSKISRRGLGFDKPAADRDDAGPTGNRASGYTFGHQGFTGTCGWADPATGVIFILLSNRINPSAENNNINRLSIRTVAQDYIYEALGIAENRSRPEVYKQQMRSVN